MGHLCTDSVSIAPKVRLEIDIFIPAMQPLSEIHNSCAR